MCSIISSEHEVLSPAYAVYNFPFFYVLRRHDDGSKLASEHVAVNKLIKTHFYLTDLTHNILVQRNYTDSYYVRRICRKVNVIGF